MELFIGFLIVATLVLLTILLAIVCSDVKKLLKMHESQQAQQLPSPATHKPQSLEAVPHP